MTQTAWQELYRISEKLERPAHVSQLMTTAEVTDFQQLIFEVLQAFIKKGELHLGLKTYIDKQLRNDFYKQMIANPPTIDQTLESWSKVIFADQKFGMILNYLEQQSNAFADRAASLVEPLLKTAGMPLGGLSFLFFMGNYGFTPFGVHKESPGEQGILFHLGPGNKEFYTWDDPELNKVVHNTQVFHDVNSMLHKAQCYEMKPGDAMFIPHHVYHIANTDEFSISFVMDYINPNQSKLENELMTEAGEEKCMPSEYYLAPVGMHTNESDWQLIADQFSTKQKIVEAFKMKILALKSNGGILRKSLVKKDGPFPSGSFTIKCVAPFKLFPYHFMSNSLVFARGHRLTPKHNSALPELIDQLNGGASISIEKIQDLLAAQWDLIEIFGFIGELLRIEAVVVEDSKTLD